MGLGKSLLRGSSMNMLDLIVKTLAVFFTTPVLIASLGKENYGAWLLVMVVVGYFLMADMGLTFAATRFLAIAVGKKDAARQAAIRQVCLRYYRLAAAGVVVLIVCLLPLLQWLAGTVEVGGEVRLAFVVAGGAVAARLCFRLPVILLRAHVRYDLLAVASTVRTLVQSAALVIVLWRGGGLLAVASIHAAGEFLELLFQSWLAARFRPSGGDDPALADAGLRGELFRYSRSIVLGNLGDSVRLQLNPLMISKIQGVAALPAFSIGTRLITILEDAVNSLFGGQVLSAFGHVHGADDTEMLRRQFLRMVHVTTGFASAATLGTVMVSGAFLQRWVGPDLQDASLVLLILSSAYAVHFSQYPAYNLMYTIGRTDWVVRVCLWGGAAGVLLSLGLGLKFGLLGVVAGTAVEMILSRGLVMAWLVGRCTQVRMSEYLFKHVLWTAVKAAALPGVAGALLMPVLSPDYPQIFLFTAVYGLVVAITFPWSSLDQEGRAMLWRHLGLRRG
jgi:O-antigen/teichoic acid export membrane protein